MKYITTTKLAYNSLLDNLIGVQENATIELTNINLHTEQAILKIDNDLQTDKETLTIIPLATFQQLIDLKILVNKPVEIDEESTPEQQETRKHNYDIIAGDASYYGNSQHVQNLIAYFEDNRPAQYILDIIKEEIRDHLNEWKE